MAFTFTETLPNGKNGSRSINRQLASLVSAIASALAAITTEQLEDGAVTADKLGAAAVSGAKLSSDAFTMKYATGVDSSSAAADITISGVTAGMRIADVLDVTNKATVDKTWFTVIEGGVTQAEGHDTHTASLLFIFLPAAA